MMIAFIMISLVLYMHAAGYSLLNQSFVRIEPVFQDRNFYGVLRITDDDDGLRTLIHGRINHGYQYFDDDEKRLWPTSYYGRQSGVGIAVDASRELIDGARPLRVGVVGLGTGTLAAYAEQGDYFRFYDINPMVVELSERYFTYRADARDRGADVDVFLGDARIVMERQVESGQQQRFDVLAVDAFSSDAIPIHLLTEECHRLYWRHLRDDGVLAVHISNRYLDIEPVVRNLASVENKRAVLVTNPDEDEQGVSSSTWILVTSSEKFLASGAVKKAPGYKDHAAPGDPPPVRWTDDFSSLYDVLSE
jgi:SAM-dependent methyltransferase